MQRDAAGLAGTHPVIISRQRVEQALHAADPLPLSGGRRLTSIAQSLLHALTVGHLREAMSKETTP